MCVCVCVYAFDACIHVCKLQGLIYCKQSSIHNCYLIQLQEKLTEYILACQDEETGGFSDRPGDMVSIYTLPLHL